MFFNYSKSSSNDDFSSFTNSTKEARLLRNEEIKIKLSQLIIQILYWYALNVSRMLTDCAEDESFAMCENSDALA